MILAHGLTDVTPAPERYLASWLCLHCQDDGPAQREYARLCRVSTRNLNAVMGRSADGAPQTPEVLSDLVCDWAEDLLPCLPEGPDPWEDA